MKFAKPGQKPEIRVWAEQVQQPETGSPKPGRKEEFRGAPGSSRVRIFIEDKGIGISKEMLPRVFEMFTRGQNDLHEGTGIGLALVRKVVQRMGGRVGVSSEQGKGSRFWMELKSVVVTRPGPKHEANL